MVGVGLLVAVVGIAVVVAVRAQRAQAAAHRASAALQQRERALVAQLRQAQQLKDELVAVVGHEFRTPLTAIQGYARTLDARYRRMDAQTMHTCAQAIERESKRLARMVNNLLLASEDIIISKEDRCVVSDVAATAVRDVIELRPAAAQNIRTHMPPGHHVAVSPEAAYQVLFHLLDNAQKFAAEDSDVRVSVRDEDEMTVLEVANVGVPINAADRGRIFDAFEQGDSSDTRPHGGMGLGLHIVSKVAAAYGGRVAVYCEGPLVIFRVWLPRVAVQHTAAGLEATSLAG